MSKNPFQFESDQEKEYWLKLYKLYIIHYELEENALDYIINDDVVNVLYKTKFLVDFINQSFCIKRIKFSDNFKIPVCDPINSRKLGVISNPWIEYISFPSYYQHRNIIKPNKNITSSYLYLTLYILITLFTVF